MTHQTHVDYPSGAAEVDYRDVTIHDLCQELSKLQEQVVAYRFCFLEAISAWHADYAQQATKMRHMAQDVARLQELVGRLMEPGR